MIRRCFADYLEDSFHIVNVVTEKRSMTNVQSLLTQTMHIL